MIRDGVSSLPEVIPLNKIIAESLADRFLVLLIAGRFRKVDRVMLPTISAMSEEIASLRESIEQTEDE